MVILRVLSARPQLPRISCAARVSSRSISTPSSQLGGPAQAVQAQRSSLGHEEPEAASEGSKDGAQETAATIQVRDMQRTGRMSERRRHESSRELFRLLPTTNRCLLQPSHSPSLKQILVPSRLLKQIFRLGRPVSSHTFSRRTSHSSMPLKLSPPPPLPAPCLPQSRLLRTPAPAPPLRPLLFSELPRTPSGSTIPPSRSRRPQRTTP